MRIHVISDGSRHAAFCPDTMAAVPIDDDALRALNATCETAPGGQAIEGQLACAEGVGGFLDTLAAPPDLGLSVPDPSPTEQGNAHDEQDRPTAGLPRLVLHVTHDCNLRCAYCYADGGSYGGPRVSMPRGTAIAAINWAVQTYGGIKQIQFFGGEPLLNPKLMFEVCEYMKVVQAAGVVDELPAYGVVTNGVLGDARALEFLRRYEARVTVSIDGPPEVHDRLRGDGTFAKADAFARLCLDDPDVQAGFECTWTPVHVEMGISPADLVDYFADRYEYKVLHVVPVSAPPGSALRLEPEITYAAYADVARHTVRTLAEGNPRANSLSWRVLEALSTRTPRETYCPAGAGTLAVSPDGGMYPCFMFAGDDRFRIWRFAEDGSIEDDHSGAITELMTRCTKTAHPDCSDCWASAFCSGCLGADLISTGDVACRSGCDLQRIIAQTVILEVASLDSMPGLDAEPHSQ